MEDKTPVRFWERIGLKWGVLLVLSGLFLWLLPFIPDAFDIQVNYDRSGVPVVLILGVILFICGAIAINRRMWG